ncbi:hypothetical protein NHH03_08795 [Stieleria sp. TO1_6]|uniref:hypothetical protein n=1 Tax=Stieleria tagensis TaxID=2956795 RepID=UPI00209B2517|nr:hypothetical protein [Stieleria tagensis]MCO8121831.1 hypothetical protein [Stieleria tagensis]
MNVYQTELLRKSALQLCLAAGCLTTASSSLAQAPSGGFHQDPATGDVYRKVTRSVVTPVVDERIERQETLVYRPETVKETRPEYKTTYLPVTEVKWRPVVQGRWNLLRQPTVAYRQVPETRWEARTEVVERTTMHTRYVPEKRTVEIPHRQVRYENRQHTELELVARAMPQPTIPSSNVDPAVVARLQPMASPNAPVSSVASRSDPSRSVHQSGMDPQVLYPSNSYSTPMTTTTIATVPSITVRR